MKSIFFKKNNNIFWPILMIFIDIFPVFSMVFPKERPHLPGKKLCFASIWMRMRSKSNICFVLMIEIGSWFIKVDLILLPNKGCFDYYNVCQRSYSQKEHVHGLKSAFLSPSLPAFLLSHLCCFPWVTNSNVHEGGQVIQSRERRRWWTREHRPHVEWELTSQRSH